MKKIFVISIILFSSFAGIQLSAVSAYSTGNINNLSKNDQLFREDIQYRLGTNNRTQIDTIITRYKAKIATFSPEAADIMTDTIIGKLDIMLYKLSVSGPLDKSLAKKPSAVYMALTLIRLELLMLK